MYVHIVLKILFYNYLIKQQLGQLQRSTIFIFKSQHCLML